MRFRLVCSALAVAMAIGVAINSNVLSASDSVEINGQTMGTTYSVKVAKDPVDSNLKSRIDERLQEIDAKMSTYRNDSELSRFNQSIGNDWFAVSKDTAFVANLAQEISTRTDGAFDVTVGPLVNLWNFGPSRRPDRFPTNEAVEQTRVLVGYQQLEVRLDPPALRKLRDDLLVDLSAIAKGYAVDEICRLLQSENLQGFMVEIGGEVRAFGETVNKSPWRIGIESPKMQARTVERVVGLKNQALASSGDYRNYFEHDGVLYSHTIDPTTGFPVNHGLAGVTVLSSDCATADALATAILVMGLESGLDFAERNNIAVLLMSRDGKNVVQAMSSTFPDERPDATTKSIIPVYFIAAAIIFGIALFGMAVGVIFSDRRIQGSCGGLAGLKDEQGRTLCEACTKPSPECSGVKD